MLKHYGEEDHGEITQTQGLGGNTDEITMEEEMEVEMEQGQEIQQQEEEEEEEEEEEAKEEDLISQRVHKRRMNEEHDSATEVVEMMEV